MYQAQVQGLVAKCGSPQPKNMSPTEGPHQSIRPRSPGALLGPTAAAAPTALGESGEQRELDQARALVLSWRGKAPHSVDPWSTQCRPMVDTQSTFRNSSLRGSIPKGRLEGGQADPPLTRELVDSIHTLMPDQHSLISQKKELAENLASAPASPFRDAPRRGRTSPPP